ncbi:hypothetical protein CBOM_04045 [Ceraceosorus bombacis]|uniref:Rad26-like C-terminal domain-containing protein n=1 Tax=Ceraceosorus bombacis TaxID=401625 RepID=A0A0P1BNP3_9BASI|nr:hypothetical protein CBOM_04045 [Ceraceosorus bombacis]
MQRHSAYGGHGRGQMNGRTKRDVRHGVGTAAEQALGESTHVDLPAREGQSNARRSPRPQFEETSSDQDNPWGSQEEETLTRIEDAWASQRVKGAAAPAPAAGEGGMDPVNRFSAASRYARPSNAAPPAGHSYTGKPSTVKDAPAPPSRSSPEPQDPLPADGDSRVEDSNGRDRPRDPQRAHPAPFAALPPAKRPRLGMGRPHGQPAGPALAMAPHEERVSAQTTSALQRPVSLAPRTLSTSALQRPQPGPDEVFISHDGRGSLQGHALPRAPATTCAKGSRSVMGADEDWDMDDPDLWADEESLRMAEEAAVFQASQAVRASQMQSELISATGRPAPLPYGRQNVGLGSDQARNSRVLARTESAPAISPSSAEKHSRAQEQRHAVQDSSTLGTFQQLTNGRHDAASGMPNRAGTPTNVRSIAGVAVVGGLPKVDQQSRAGSRNPMVTPIADLAGTAEEKLRQLEDERRKARQAADGEINILRSRHTKLEKEADQLRKQNAELAVRHADELERIRREREEERMANERQAAFGHIQNATSSRWVAGGSVRRRAPATLLRDGSGPNSSAAQRAGLTTPTKRGGRMLRNLGSGGRSQDRESEESPRSQRRANDILPFPNLDNSFALPKSRRASHKEQQTLTEPQFLGESPSSQLPGTPTACVLEAKQKRESLWSDPLARYPWMQASYTKKRAELLGSVIAHTKGLQESVLLPVADSAQDETHARAAQGASQDRTLQRLLNASLSRHTDRSLQVTYAMACSELLALLSSPSDASLRFSFLAHRLGKDQGNKELEDEDWYDANDLFEQGLDGTVEELVQILLRFLSVFWDSRSLDGIIDVLDLFTSLSLRHASAIRAALFVSDSSEQEREFQQNEDDAMEEVVQTDDSAAARDEQRLDTPSKRRKPGRPRKGMSFAETLIAYVRLAATPARQAKAKSEAAQAFQTTSLDKKLHLPTAARPDDDCLSQPAETDEVHASWQLTTFDSERLLAAVAHVLQVMSVVLQTHEVETLRQLFKADGFLGTLLLSSRSTSTLLRVLRMLTSAIRFPSAWHVILACPMDKTDLAALHPRVSNSPAPLFELLCALLKDSETARRPSSEMHAIHQTITVFLTQLVMTQPQSLPIVAESAPLLTALVRRMYEDTTVVWHLDGVSTSQLHVDSAQLVARLVSTVRLLGTLYAFPERPVSLARRISSDACHAVYNGARHAYILSLSRIAFAEEPEWIAGEERDEMQEVGDLATELLELVLTPDELDAAWELCADRSDSDEPEKMEGAGDAEGDAVMGPGPTQASETQYEEEEAMQMDVGDVPVAQDVRNTDSHLAFIRTSDRNVESQAKSPALVEGQVNLCSMHTPRNKESHQVAAMIEKPQHQEGRGMQGGKRRPIYLQVSDSEEEE